MDISAFNFIGQIIFGAYFVYSGINHFKRYKNMTAYAASVGVPSPSLAVYGSGALLVLGGIGVLLRGFIAPQYTFIGLILLVIFLIPVSFLMHAFWKNTDPQTRTANTIQFLKNMALLGAVLMLLK